jgi:hypothetical protein
VPRGGKALSAAREQLDNSVRQHFLIQDNKLGVTFDRTIDGTIWHPVEPSALNSGLGSRLAASSRKRRCQS